MEWQVHSCTGQGCGSAHSNPLQSVPDGGLGFVFVDDFCWLLRKTTSELLTTALLLFLTAFGCPLSWKKTAIGASNTWLGFVVTPHLWSGWHPQSMSWSWESSPRWWPMTALPDLSLTVPWDGYNGQLRVVLWQNRFFNPFGNGSLQWRHQGNPANSSGGLPTYSINSLPRTTTTLHLLLPEVSGGEQVMQVQPMRKHMWVDGSRMWATPSKPRFGGSTIKWPKLDIPGPSRTSSPSGE